MTSAATRSHNLVFALENVDWHIHDQFMLITDGNPNGTIIRKRQMAKNEKDCRLPAVQALADN